MKIVLLKKAKFHLYGQKKGCTQTCTAFFRLWGSYFFIIETLRLVLQSFMSFTTSSDRLWHK